MNKLKKTLALLLTVMLVFSSVGVGSAAKVTSAKTNFTKGEFSPLLLGRIDIAAYANGAKKIENFLILNAGGATRRPGSYYVAEVKTSILSTRLIDFQFSTEQAYILEMGNLYLRFYTLQGQVQNTTHAITGASQDDPCVITSVAHPFQNGDTVAITEIAVGSMVELNDDEYTVASRTADTYELADENSGGYAAYVAGSGGIATRTGALEIPTPYTTTQLFDVQYAQSADVAYMVHASHEVMKLERLSATSWRHTEVNFVRGPFMDANITAVTITPTSDDGATVLNSSAGDIFHFVTGVAAADQKLVGSLFKVKGGVVKIATVASATQATGTVQAEPDGSAGALGTGPGATTDWAEGAWSNFRGFPTSVTFHEGRLVFAKGQEVFASYSQSFENFAAGSNAADAFIYKIATEQVNAIRWMSSGPKALQVGTSGSTFSFSSGEAGIPITPTAIVVTRDTTYGSAKVLPKRIGNFVYFIQRNLKVLRELGFDFDTDSQQALDMTLLSDHITGDGIVDMAYQQAPNDTLWCVRSDGQMATLTRQIDQEVIGWARQISGRDSIDAGKYESVAVVPIDEGNDEVWVIVRRYINGEYVRYIEYFKPREFDDDHDAFFVDSGLTLDEPKSITSIVPKTEIDYMEYANNTAARLAYVSSDADFSIDVFRETDARTNEGEYQSNIGYRAGTLSPFYMHMGRDSTVYYDSWVRFDNITIPQGSLIVSAQIVFTSSPYTTTGTCYMRIWAIDEDNTADLTTNPYGRDLTTAYTDWTVGAWSSGEKGPDTTTSNFKTSVQEVVNREGWSSGNALGIALKNNGSPAGQNWRGAYGNYSGATLDPELTIVYIEPHLQCHSENTIIQQGTHSLRVVAVKTDSLDDTLTRTLASTIDLSDKNTIKLKVRASRTGSNFKIGFHDDGGVTTEHTINIAEADAWQTEEIDISGVANADKNVINQIIITILNADEDNIFYVDNIHVPQLSVLPIPSPIVTITTSAAHGFVAGDIVIIQDVVGMTELNGNQYIVDYIGVTSFNLNDLSDVPVDGTDFADYVSGGEVRKMVTTISSLTHLVGEIVAVCADGEARPDNIVSAAGKITLALRAAVVHVGLPYTPVIQGLPLVDGSATGTGAGKTRRVYKAIIRFYRTSGVLFGDEDVQDSINFSDTDFFTGLKEPDPPGGWDLLGEFYITQTQPLPLTVLYVVLLSEVNE